MRRALQATLVAGVIALLFGVNSVHGRRRPHPAGQLIVVVADGWSSTVGELQRFARGGDGRWRRVGEPVAVSLGKSGLGRAHDDLAPGGRANGLAPRASAAESAPDKSEGDGRSPAGRFALGLVTGYDAAPPAGTRMPYRQATAALRCVDDGRSPAYNREVDVPVGGAPWSSDEAMRRDDELYRLTVFVAHNAGRVPGQGSCIFLHVWRAPAAPTVGCTAMALERLRELVAWLDPGQEPRLVQLPREEYRRLQRDWDLPPLVDKRK